MLKLNPVHLEGLDLGGLFSGVETYSQLGLAVSGGPDSLALMLLVRAWCDLRGADAPGVYVYSVDHGLRPEAAAEAANVVYAANGLGFTGRVLEWQGSKPATGIQAAARAARYQLIGAAMVKDGVPALVTAHHVGDQAETLLMRMAHGSGVTGLGGMAAWSVVEGVKVHHPLLGLRRAALHDIVTRSGYLAADDPSNSDIHYERVRWRQIMPLLSEHGLTDDRLDRLAMRMQRADAALAAAADQAFALYVNQDIFGVAHLPLSGFGAIQDEIALRVLARMFQCTGRSAPRLEQLEQLHKAAGNPEFSGICLSGAEVRVCNGDILVFAEAGRMVPPKVQIAAGEKHLWDERFEIDNSGPAPIIVDHSAQLNRADAETFMGQPVRLPMAAIASAPSIFDANGTLIGLGLFTRSQEVDIKLAG